MCGLVGFVDHAGLAGDAPSAGDLLRRLATALRHRGPDDDGVWFDPQTRCGLGFRRLAIVDLTPAGHQPMTSESGRFTVAFNGEVYNFRSLREELAAGGYRFRSHSDTEVMLAAFEAWGVRAATERFVGMFAFAVHDRRDRILTLGRDRLGVKPLYYGLAGGSPPGGASFANEARRNLAFASELKALRPMPGMRHGVDRTALAHFLRFGYVPTPYSIHPDVRKLPPGHLLHYRIDAATATLERYWSAREVAERGLADPFRGDDRAAVEAVEAALDEAVRLRMVADVPLGAFLSGGIDSSAVVASMQAQSARPVRTFTIGFREAEFDESMHARAVARHLGTEHVERFVTGEEAAAVIPRIPDIWDEPFGDSSQIPTFLLSETARTAVTVALSGDGGDELFGGYYRYGWTSRIAEAFGRIPRPLRRLGERMALALPAGALDRTLGPLGRRLPAGLATDRPGTRLQKLARLSAEDDPWAMYLRLCSFWPDEPGLVLGDVAGTPPPLLDPDARMRGGDLETRMMQADLVSYLVDDLLVKVDRASMAVGLEAREPLLDHRLVELAFRLPLGCKIRDGERKWVLRRVLERRVPARLFDRPKMGFAIPLADWLRGPLRAWAESLLSSERLEREGFLRPEPIRHAWSELLGGRSHRTADLWNVLMFQAWLERWSEAD